MKIPWFVVPDVQSSPLSLPEYSACSIGALLASTSKPATFAAPATEMTASDAAAAATAAAALRGLVPKSRYARPARARFPVDRKRMRLLLDLLEPRPLVPQATALRQAHDNAPVFGRIPVALDCTRAIWGGAIEGLHGFLRETRGEPSASVQRRARTGTAP